MASAYDGSIKIDTRVDVKGLEDAVEKIRKSLKDMSGSLSDMMSQPFDQAVESSKGLKAVGAAADEVSDSVSGLSNEYEDLDAIVQRAMDRMQNSRSVANGGALYEPARIGVAKLATSTDDLNKAMTEAEKEIKKTGKSAKETRQGVDGLGDQMGKAAQQAKKSADGLTTWKVALADLAARGIDRAVSAIGNMLEKSRDFRLDMSKLETSASLAGVSMDTLNESMRNLNFITGETDSNVEALSNLLQAGYKDNELMKAVDELSGAVIQFPDTLKIESLADGLQETLATGKAAGQFAELLERLGENLEEFDNGLKRATKSGNAQQYAMEYLARHGLSDVNRLYRDQHKGLEAAANAQYDMNEALARFSEAIDPAITALLEFLTPIVTAISLIAQLDPQMLMVIATMLLMVTVVIKVTTAITNITDKSETLKDSLLATDAKMIRTTAIIIGVVVALVALGAIIAVIMGRADDLGRTFDKIGESTNRLTNSVSEAQNSLQGGGRRYARGTLSAPRGRALVGENGPELVDFAGGERVYTAQQSRALMASSGGGRASTINVVFAKGSVVLDPRNIESLNDLARIALNEKLSMQMGYVGR